MTSRPLQYLALGDSYTIGESVAPELNFPNQLWRMANEQGLAMEIPRIVATTGWTTDELMKGIDEANTRSPIPMEHDLVTLLIGVNNQYRGRPTENFKEELIQLVDRALSFAGSDAKKLVLISIPDWGVTPFAEGRDRDQIATEIDAYNQVVADLAKDKGIHYIYVTKWTREAVADPALLAADGLHPSGLEYERWSLEILRYLKNF